MNITLIGMPTSGKSTLGVILAKVLCKNFVDTDILIQEKYNKSLCQIIEQEGLEEFLKKEEMVVIEGVYENSIIATGGSVIYSSKAMEKLKGCSRVIYLEAPIEVIKERLLDIHTRGIVMNPEQTLTDLYNERKTLYEKYADVTVSTDEENMEKIVDKLVEVI